MKGFSVLYVLVFGSLYTLKASFGQTQGCIKGFNNITGGSKYTSGATHFIVPDMNFSCNGIIAEIVFLATNQVGQLGTIQFEVWRPEETIGSSISTYVLADETNATQFLESHATKITVRPTMTVSSKDVLGISINKLNISSQSFDSFTVYQLKSDAIYSDQANILSSYESTFFSPLVSVLFVTENSQAVLASLEDSVAVIPLTTNGMSDFTTSGTRCVSCVSSLESLNSLIKSTPDVESSPELSMVSSSGANNSNGKDSQLPSEGPSYAGIIVGIVVAVVIVVLAALLLVGCVLFSLHSRTTKKQIYFTSAHARSNSCHHSDASVTNAFNTTSNAVRLAMYDDPDAYIQPMPYEEPVHITLPPLPPSNDTKEVYETVQQQDGDSLKLVNPLGNTSGYEVVVRQEDPVSGVVLTADGRSALYDTITDGGKPLQPVYNYVGVEYNYVQNKDSRKEDIQPKPSSTLEDELRSIYGGVTKPEFEDQPFVSPGRELNTIYGQLADKKCIEIPRSYLKQETVLGTGEFGDVFKGVWDTPYGPQDVAIKMLKVGSKEKDKVNFLKEAALMGQFRHPNVIRLLGAVTVDDPCMIVLEFLPRKDLKNYLHSQNPEPGVLPEATLATQLLNFCCDIAGGMKYLSNKGFVHRDLAARNILLDKNLKCKIADFGLSKTLQPDSEYYIAKGGRVPVKWTAPEALFYKKYTTSSDVWSYGMVMYEIWSLGEKPFGDLSVLNVVKVLRNDTSYVQSPPPGCPKDIYRLMVCCWDHNHHNRPNFNAIHSVLSGPADSLLTIPNDDLQQTKDPLKAGQLGMPLEFGEDLYMDLQRYYHKIQDQ